VKQVIKNGGKVVIKAIGGDRGSAGENSRTITTLILLYNFWLKNQKVVEVGEG
jgi:hypothetical protein